MIRILPPVSNAERQRQFRERNPGYSKPRHARTRAGFLAAMEATGVVAASEGFPALPAPVEIIEIPGIDSTDRRIDSLVYPLDGLTDEEIRIVEEATK